MAAENVVSGSAAGERGSRGQHQRNEPDPHGNRKEGKKGSRIIAWEENAEFRTAVKRHCTERRRLWGRRGGTFAAAAPSYKKLNAGQRRTQGPAGEGGGVMKDLKASDVMVRPVVAARKNAPVRDVVFQFLNGFYSGMPVTDDAGSVIGVITELDILQAVLAGKELVKITAGDIMTPKPVTVDVGTPLTEVVKIMKEKNIIRLPVTEEGKLVGIVARCDILTTLIEPEFVTYM